MASKSNAALAAVDEDTTDTSRETETEEQAEARIKAELDAAVVKCQWKGTGAKPVTFTIPKRRGRWPVEAAEAFDDEKYTVAIRCLVGAEAWEQLKVICPTVDDVNELGDYVGEVIAKQCVP